MEATGTGTQLSWVALGLCLGWWFFGFLWCRLQYDIHKIPQPPLWPLLGAGYRCLVHGEKPRMHSFGKKWIVKYGKIFRVSFLGVHVVVCTDPTSAMKDILGWGDNGLSKGWIYNMFRRLKSFKGGGLLVREHSDAKYRMVRKTMAPAFSTHRLKKSVPVFLEKGQKLVDIIEKRREKGKPFDMQELSIFLTFDAVGKFAFDVDFDSLDNGSHPMLDAMTFGTEDGTADFLNPIRALVKKVLPFLKMSQEARRMNDQMYQEHLKLAKTVFLRAEPDKDDHSIAACLRRLESLEVKLTREELLAEVATMIVAATDSTSHQLAWTVALIASHPDVQRRLVDELHGAGLHPGGRDPTYQDLSRLKYLNAVIKEAFRICPAVPLMSARVASRDVVVDGYRLPKGTVLGACILGLNNAPWLWEEPDVFKPERWEKVAKCDVEEGSVLESRTKGASKKLWTFSYGPRDCVGQRLAVVELQMALVILCSRYWLELDDRMGGWEGCKEKMFDSLVVACEGGIWVHAKPHLEE